MNNSTRSFASSVVFLTAILLVALPLRAQDTGKPRPTGALRPLTEILDPDGTLKVGPGTAGSFDPAGFRIVTGQSGRPLFLPAGSETQTAGGEITLAAGDENWHPFDQPWTLVNGTVYAIAVDGTDVYVGGDFTWAGQNTDCRHIARWDTLSGLWEALSGGLDGIVYAIAVSGTNVYAGGAFTGHISVFHNGTGLWQNLGANNTVYALAVSGTDVYAGGYFTTPASYIAKWNGTAWSVLGTGVNGGVFALAASGTDVYVGGDFTQAGGASANYIAKWTGSAWSSLGSGLNEYADAISVSGSDVYVGGNFTQAGGGLANYAAKWNGTGWSALGDGLNWHFPSVGGSALVAKGLDVYVGGVFTQAGATLANYIARWNGSSWGALGSGLNNMVSAIAVSGTDVYVGGQFTTAGGQESYYLARWVEPLAVVSPNGGESWDVGSMHAVTWTVDASLGPMKIECSTNNGATWTTVVASTPNTGTYSWTLPNTPSASCRIRVSEAADGDPADSSDGLFTIAGIRVTSPNGGEQLIVGSQHTITWVTAGGYPTVRIELSQNGGSVWETIIASTANTGSYLWTVPAAIFSQGLIRVSDSADGVPADASDVVFSTIAVPFIQVTRPNGGEIWEPGWAVHIYYNDNITENFVKVELSADGGSYWTTLDSFAVSNGIFSWTVSNSPSTACLVRVSETFTGIPVDTSDAPFTITGFQVTAPNGVQLEPGDPQTITWNTIGSYPDVKIEFSANSGQTWETVTESAANSGSFPWTVPEVTTYQALIRVSDPADGLPYGLGGFSIVEPPPPPSIQVLSPNGGEMWLAGSSHEITWTSSGVSGLMRIFYSTDNGVNFTTVAITQNDGFYTWTVPSTVSSACLVRIIDLNALAPADTSDAVFRIVGEPTIAITSPNGGERWIEGSAQTITWNTAGSIPTVDILFSANGGTDWSYVVEETANTGSYAWTVPYNPQTQCLIRVMDAADGDPSGTSDAVFTIITASPTKKVDLNGDGQEDILWRYHGEGAYQGLNVAWLMNQTEALSPAPLRSAEVASPGRSLLSGAPAGVVYQASRGGQSPPMIALAVGSKSVLSGEKTPVLSAKNVMRVPMEHERGSSRPAGRSAGDRDGRDCLVRQDAASPEVLSSGDARITSLQLATEVVFSQIPDTQWEIAGTGDFNGDTKTDILWRYYGVGDYQGLNDIWFMDGTTFTGESVFSQVADTNWRIAGTGDFNGDGDTDILWRYYGAGDYQGLNVIWYMNDAQMMGEAVFSQVLDTDWRIEGTGDFNSDGQTDILWRYYGAGDYQGLNDIWFMNGSTFVGESVFSQIMDTAWQVGGTGDFNNDGQTDILWRYYGQGPYQGLNDIWYMNGTAFVSEEVFSQIPDTSWRIVNR